jgi:hypothetical protein
MANSYFRRPEVSIVPAEIVDAQRLRRGTNRIELKVLARDYRASSDTIVLNSSQGGEIFSHFGVENPLSLQGFQVWAHYHYSKGLVNVTPDNPFDHSG